MNKNKILWVGLVTLIVTTLLIGCVGGPIVNDTTVYTADFAVVLNTDNFDSLVLKDSGVALVEFYRPGCSVCHEIMWIIDSLAEIFGDEALVGAVNVDSSTTLIERFTIPVIPTYILFNNRDQVLQRSYYQADSSVFDTLAALLSKSIAGSLTSETTDTGTITIHDTSLTKYLTLDSLTFDTTVLRQGRVAMIFFLYAGGFPCIYMDSVVAGIVPLFSGRAVIAKVHAWEQHTVTDRYGINMVPHFLFFKDSVEVISERRLGIAEGDTLVSVLNRLLK